MSRAYKLILASTLVSQVVLAQPVVQPPPPSLCPAAPLATRTSAPASVRR
jgi:hypothetical protein